MVQKSVCNVWSLTADWLSFVTAGVSTPEPKILITRNIAPTKIATPEKPEKRLNSFDTVFVSVMPVLLNSSVLIDLGFGVAFGTNLVRLFTDKVSISHVNVGNLDQNYIWLALITAALAFTILFSASKEHFFWVLLAGSIGYFSTSLSSQIIGADLGAFVGGFSVGITANLYARLTKHPALTITMPGLILLVPGSVGFKGLSFLVEKNTLAGIDTTFEMFLIAIALVSGLLLANIMVTPRRSL